jgi:hypothetical protein
MNRTEPRANGRMLIKKERGRFIQDPLNGRRWWRPRSLNGARNGQLASLEGSAA